MWYIALFKADKVKTYSFMVYTGILHNPRICYVEEIRLNNLKFMFSKVVLLSKV